MTTKTRRVSSFLRISHVSERQSYTQGSQSHSNYVVRTVSPSKTCSEHKPFIAFTAFAYLQQL